jgi:hypothetical protein
MKRKPFEYYKTAAYPAWGAQWVVHSTIDYDNPQIRYFRAVVETRKVARDLIRMLKGKYPPGKWEGTSPA